jgi:hypothetical protein
MYGKKQTNAGARAGARMEPVAPVELWNQHVRRSHMLYLYVR